jgi:hypothetical protein
MRVVYELRPGEASWDAQRLAISTGSAVELLLKYTPALQSFQLLPDKFAVETALTLDAKRTAPNHLPQLTTVAGLMAVDDGPNLGQGRRSKIRPRGRGYCAVLSALAEGKVSIPVSLSR